MSMWMFDSFYDVWYVMLYNCHSRFFSFKKDLLKKITFLYFSKCIFIFIFYE